MTRTGEIIPDRRVGKQYDVTMDESKVVKHGELAEDADMYGHPRFYEILSELAGLHSIKNHDYAIGGNPLGNFSRRAKIFSLYPGLDLSDPAVVTIIDAMKQLDAFLWFCSNKHQAKVEGKIERLKDISVLSVLAMIMEEEKGE